MHANVQSTSRSPVVRLLAAVTVTISLWIVMCLLLIVPNQATAQPVSPAGPTAATQVVTVTTTADNLDAPDISSLTALLANPGADGKVSFREALEAANKTVGNKSLVFDPALAGSSIYIQNGGWPILTSGDLSISGDTDGDGQPDITLDGSLAGNDGPMSNALILRSSNITIASLTIRSFTNTGIMGGWLPNAYPDGFTISGLRILSNTISDVGHFQSISIGPLWLRSACAYSATVHQRIEDVTIAGNTLTNADVNAVAIMLMAGAVGSQYGSIVSATIAGNRMVGFGGSISLLASDTDTTYGGCPPPARYSDHNAIRNAVIAGNVISDVTYKGILVSAANMGNSYNEVTDVVVIGNHITGRAGQYHYGIIVEGAGGGKGVDRLMTGNVVSNVLVTGNTITGTAWAIAGFAGDTAFGEPHLGTTGNSLISLTVSNNLVIGTVDRAIAFWAGRAVSPWNTYIVTGNLISSLAISGNTVLTGTSPWEPPVGITLLGGWGDSGCTGCVAGNQIMNVSLADNRAQGFGLGLRVHGGTGASAISNTVQGAMSGNGLSGNGAAWEIGDNADGAAGNWLLGNWLRWAYLPVVLRSTGP